MVPVDEDPISKQVNLAYLLLSYFLKFYFNITFTLQIYVQSDLSSQVMWSESFRHLSHPICNLHALPILMYFILCCYMYLIKHTNYELLIMNFSSIVVLVEDRAMLPLQSSNRSSEMLALHRVVMPSLRAECRGFPNQLYHGPEREPP